MNLNLFYLRKYILILNLFHLKNQVFMIYIMFKNKIIKKKYFKFKFRANFLIYKKNLNFQKMSF